jgi:hypothetical protein
MGHRAKDLLCATRSAASLPAGGFTRRDALGRGSTDTRPSFVRADRQARPRAPEGRRGAFYARRSVGLRSPLAC